MWLEKLVWLLCCWIIGEAGYRYVSILISGIYEYNAANLIIGFSIGTVLYFLADELYCTFWQMQFWKGNRNGRNRRKD